MGKNEAYLSFKFTGDNEIGIDEFSKFLSNISKYLKSIKEDLNDSNINMEPKVIAIKKGSFEVIISPIIDVFSTLILPVVENTTAFVELAVKVLSVIEFLQGKPPKEINETSITNYYGDQININAPVHLVFSSENGDTLKSIEKLCKEIPKNRELEIKGNLEKEKIVINSENRSHFSDIENNFEEVPLKNISKEQTIIVRKPSLDMESKWTIYTDKSIQVEIKDETFAELVKRGKISFSNNSKLIVDIETTSYPYNNRLKPSYVVTKVYLNEKITEQQKLDI